MTSEEKLRFRGELGQFLSETFCFLDSKGQLQALESLIDRKVREARVEEAERAWHDYKAYPHTINPTGNCHQCIRIAALRGEGKEIKGPSCH